jgi:hypothetical protein
MRKAELAKLPPKPTIASADRQVPTRQLKTYNVLYIKLKFKTFFTFRSYSECKTYL